MSLNSSARTWVIDCDSADTISGNRSVIPPGWIPVPWTEVPPAAHAASIADSSRPAGKNQLSGVTTLAPEARIRATIDGSAMIGEYTTQSAPSASSASTSSVAVTPSGSMPHSSPTSTPTLSALCTQHPTSSSSGWATMPATAARPTPPVAHWITLMAIVVPLRAPRCRVHRRPERTTAGTPRAEHLVPCSVAGRPRSVVDRHVGHWEMRSRPRETGTCRVELACRRSAVRPGRTGVSPRAAPGIAAGASPPPGGAHRHEGARR